MLTRSFALAGAVVLVAAAAGIAARERALDTAQLAEASAQSNVALTRAFANLIWPGFREFVATARGLPIEALRAHPKNVELDAVLRRLMAETEVEKVKIYAPDGLTVYSTDPSQIGGEYGDNPRFLAAIASRSASLLEFRDRFGAFAGPLENRWILSSYVAMRTGEPEQPIEGVAEIYRDVTDQYARIERENAVELGEVAVAFAAVFVLLLALVWRTERRLLEQHRREIELTAAVARAEAAVKEKSTFLANMSHQLRTPLNAILGFAKMIEEERLGPIKDTRYKDYASDIATAGEQLLGTINDVLLLVQIDAGMVTPEIEPIDLARLAAAVIEAKQNAAAAAGVALTIEAVAGLPTVDSDEGLIRQVLLRLVDNAIKFTPSGGRVNLGFGGGKPGGRLSAYVADNGVGMRAEDIPVALAPFGVVDASLARRPQAGVGLGLSLARQLAATAGAELSIESNLGSGTRVTVSFPLHVAAAQRSAA